MNETDLLRNLTTELAAWERSPSTRRLYPDVVKRYLAATKPENIFARAGVNEYLVKLDKEGKSKNTKRFEFYVIKRFFEVNDQKWPFKGAGLKRPSEKELHAPVMPSQDVRKLVQSRDSLEDWETGIVALSTTYGLRQEEILQVGEDDIYDGKIFIHTVKGGVETEHLLPETILSYVEAWAGLPDRHRPAKSTLFVLFHSICRRCGVDETEDRMGFHAIRRRLATDLREAEVDSGIVYQFLRWQLSTVLGMLGVYSHIDQEKVDRIVFNAHPWLHLWD